MQAGQGSGLLFLMPGKLNEVIEIKVLAQLAQGKRILAIADELGIHEASVDRIKRNNKDKLNKMIEKVRVVQDGIEFVIRNKVNTKILQRLAADDLVSETKEKVLQMFYDKQITWNEYQSLVKDLKQIPLSELINASKEMYHQSGPDAATPANSEDMSALASAIASGDAVQITQAMKVTQLNINKTN